MNKFHPYLDAEIYLLRKTDELDQDLKNIVLKFLFVFNIFESNFFEEPKYENTENGKKIKTKSVSQRSYEIQEFCEDKNYPLEFLKRFQSHFKKVYDEKIERFESLRKAEDNPNGYDDKNMRHIEDFLIQSLENNKKYALRNALSLSYRFRNNLFHGQKRLDFLQEYKNDFEAITNFLINLMKYLNEIDANVF